MVHLFVFTVWSLICLCTCTNGGDLFSVCRLLHLHALFYSVPCVRAWMCVLASFINTCVVCVCVWWRAEPTRQTTTKRRKRKNSASSASNSNLGNSAGGKKRSPANNFSLTSQVPVSIKSSSLHTHIHPVLKSTRFR